MVSDKGVIVLLPTYNESGNLVPMLQAIHGSLPGAHVLVIDDNSPDGTGHLADKAAAEDAAQRIFVAHRPGKQGLGVAYRYGYRWALDHGYTRVLQMDCDFSHDPKDLPRMVELLERYPVVVGSRRVPGGGSVGWPWYRNAISTAGSLYARTVLASPVNDLTTGFKGFRAEALRALPLDKLRTDGFGFQIEVTSCFIALGYEVHEMPIRFIDREVGESKMSAKIFVEAMLKVWSIRGEVNALKREVRA
ncbi:polyprenol monophosphomannose synthase [Myxococcota bacterium]|nr:polyprenol monophosphomannose synthase [Myxococcota bacterium]